MSDDEFCGLLVGTVVVALVVLAIIIILWMAS